MFYVVLVVLGFALREPVYTKHNEYVYCKEYMVDEDVSYHDEMYVETVYFVKEGLLKRIVYCSHVPFAYYEQQGLDRQSVYNQLMSEYVYRGYQHRGYLSYAPYYDVDSIVNPYLIVDFTELILFSEEEVPSYMRTSNREGVIFEYYFEAYHTGDSCVIRRDV